MIRINLLSLYDRENNKWERINNFIINVTINIAVILIIFVVIFFVAIKYLDSENSNTEDKIKVLESNKEIKEIRNIELYIKEYEKKLEYASSIQEKHLYWVPILEEFGKTVPKGVSISNFNVEKNIVEPTEKLNVREKKGEQSLDDDRSKIKITGYADTRENLLNFEDNLKSSAIFVDLVSSRSNYVDPVNISFEYSFFIGKESLLFKK